MITDAGSWAHDISFYSSSHCETSDKKKVPVSSTEQLHRSLLSRREGRCHRIKAPSLDGANVGYGGLLPLRVPLKRLKLRPELKTDTCIGLKLISSVLL